MSVPAFLAAVHARNAGGARAALAPTFRGSANGRPLDHDGQVRLLESFWLGFPDGDFRMEPTGGSGRHVITWTFSGTHGGVYLGVPPTGAPVALSGFIISVSDRTGITQLDWKWDTKAFTKAVLGPDQVGDLDVKDSFRDPSQRWQRGPGTGQGKRRKKGKGPRQGGPPGQPRHGQPRRQPGQGEQAAGQPGQPTEGAEGIAGRPQRQRRPRKQRPEGEGEGTSGQASAESAGSAASGGEPKQPGTDGAGEPRPDT